MSTLSDLMLGTAKRSSFFTKDHAKALRATQYVGQGSPRSSTHSYAVAMGPLANTGIYGPRDVVFVSCEGNRTGRFRPVVDGVPRGAYAQLDKAIAAGAAIVVDVPFDRERSYNVGEREVAAYLLSKGLVEREPGLFSHP